MATLETLPAVRVMIVEDEALYAMQLQICLDELGYEAIGPASEAGQALALFASADPDLVLLDIGLRGELDGIELGTRLRALRADIPLLFITAFSDRVTFERARTVGPLAYVNKPFTVPTVQHAIELALQQTRSLETLAPGERPAIFARPPLNTTVAAAPAADAPWSEDVLVRDAFFVKSRDRLIKVRQQDVLAIEASSGYSLLRTRTGGQFLLNMPIGKLEEKLVGSAFIRTHRTWLVNADLIDEVLLDQNAVRLQTLTVPVSNNHRPTLLRRLQMLS